jgi:hypothetical protein
VICAGHNNYRILHKEFCSTFYSNLTESKPLNVLNQKNLNLLDFFWQNCMQSLNCIHTMADRIRSSIYANSSGSICSHGNCTGLAVHWISCVYWFKFDDDSEFEWGFLLSCITSILLYFLPQLDNGAPQHNSVLFGHHYLEAIHLAASTAGLTYPLYTRDRRVLQQSASRVIISRKQNMKLHPNLLSADVHKKARKLRFVML